jgi:voltage-gated potassium channel
MKVSAIQKQTAVNLTVAVLIVASIIIVFVEYLFTLTDEQIWAMYTFDLIVTGILAVDFAYRLKRSESKVKYAIAHWYEFPAMIPLVAYALIDGSLLIQLSIGTLRYLALFRLGRLYNLLSLIKGSEIFLLSAAALVTVIFGSFGIYIAESQSTNPNANILNLHDAFWWSIETITTVAYGEYYPVTFFGRVIAGILMFAAIGILWTVIALFTSKLVEKRVKQSTSGIIQDTKDLIKEKIDNLENLDKTETEELIRLIRGINNSD